MRGRSLSPLFGPRRSGPGLVDPDEPERMFKLHEKRLLDRRDAAMLSGAEDSGAIRKGLFWHFHGLGNTRTGFRAGVALVTTSEGPRFQMIMLERCKQVVEDREIPGWKVTERGNTTVALALACEEMRKRWLEITGEELVVDEEELRERYDKVLEVGHRGAYYEIKTGDWVIFQ